MMMNSRDPQRVVFTTFFAWWKPDMDTELAYRYWRDVHGVWASRAPGFHQYRQLHLGPIDPEQATLGVYDVIYVPRTFIGDANAFVRLYIRGLMPTMPRVGIGFQP